MKRAYCSVALFIVLSSAQGADRLGPTSPIVEPDIRDEIQKTLREKERTGEIARLQREAADRVKRSAEEPRPVDGLERTTRARTFYFDPTFVQPKSIYDHQGRLIAAAGMAVNPLQYVTVPTKMLFFDARDQDQVKKAFAIMGKNPDAYKAVLVGGRPFDLMRARKVRVYFDQGGGLSRRFGIRQVPALVSQEGYRLRIDEMTVTP